MSKFTSKVLSVILTTTTVLSLSGLGSTGVASAATNEELQAQITALLATISGLQAQMSGTAMTGTSGYAFTRDLTVGARGADVTALQQLLVSKGHLVMPAGVAYGYFGALTKTAVAAWQSASGITPAAGYFGAKSRAAVAAMGGTGTGTGTGTQQPPIVNTGSSLLVSKGSGTVSGSAIAGAGQIAVGNFAFTAPASMGVTITGLTFQKVGVLSNSNISNMYLANGSGEVVAQYQSISNLGVVTFANMNIMVNAAQTWVGQLRADISTGATSGNTLAFDLTGAMTVGNVPVLGLPVAGNTMTVTSVSNPSIAGLTLTANAVGSTVDAGTVSALVSSWTAAVTNSAVDLKNIQFTFVGSANPTHFANLRLMVNGTQVASLPSAANSTVFTLTTPIRLNTGNSTIQIFADVMGSPNRTATFSILQPYMVNAVDTQYGAGITASVVTTNQTTITINTGSITLQVSSDSPSTSVPAGVSGVTLAKFRFYAAGEAVKIKFIDVVLTETGSSAWTTIGNVTDDIANLRVTDDAGGQMGNSIGTLTSGTTTGTCTLASTTVTCHFGTSASPINYTVPANTTRTLSIISDIGASTDMTTLSAGFVAGSSNMEGQTSFVSTLSSGAATGAARTVTASSLTPAINSGFSAPTVISSQVDAKIASFIITAASAQGATVYSLTLEKDTNTSVDLQNVFVKVLQNGSETQFGSVWNTLNDTGSDLTQTFSVSNPIVIPAGGSVTVNVYGTILGTSAAATYTSVIDLQDWSAQGAISGSAITMVPTFIDGQNLTISSGPTLTIAADSGTPSAKQVVMGTTGVELFKVRFTANNADDVNIDTLVITDRITAAQSANASFYNFSLWDGASCVAGCSGGPAASTTIFLDTVATSTVTFNISPVVTIPKNNGKTLTVKADVTSFDSGAVDKSVHTFFVAEGTSANIVAKSKNSPTATVTLVAGTVASMSSNTATVYRTKLTLSGAKFLGSSASSRTRAASDPVAEVTFNNIGASELTISTVVVQLSGIALAGNGQNTYDTFLVKQDGSAFGSSSATVPTSCTTGIDENNTCIATFSPAFILSGNASQTVQVKVNSSNFYNASSSGQEGLSIFLSAATSVLWNDGTTGSIPLDTSVNPVPFTLADITYN